jgi:MFS family permease
LITLFSFSGAFANISYTDILGKSIKSESRKSFLSFKYVVAGIGIFLSAVLARKILSAYSFPENYTIMFIIAALVLGIASLGFWSIKESIASGFAIKRLKDYKAAINIEIKKNKRLKYFLAIINTLGISISILPFLILYAKDNFASDRLETGNYLLLKIAGSVLSGMILTIISSKIKYRNILYLTPLIFLLIPAYIMINANVSYFYILFFVGGIGYSFYSISTNGVLLEITNNNNRALYTGIAGAGSIIPTLFTLSGGVLIQKYGFNFFFILYILVLLSSIYFIHKLKCMK